MDTLLKEYVAVKLDIVVTGNSWDAIYDKINEGENGLHKTDNDIKQLFNKMVVKVGDNADTIRPFVDLIPNEYGLSVVKAGIALVLLVCWTNAYNTQNSILATNNYKVCCKGERKESEDLRSICRSSRHDCRCPGVQKKLLDGYRRQQMCCRLVRCGCAHG